jgi:hypothetical protein
MKSFFHFLSEAQSQASMQAKKLNLKSDGHGGWLDTRGKFVATTEDGKLKFVDKKKAKVDDETKKSSQSQAQTQTRKVEKPQKETQPKTEKAPEKETQKSGDGETITVAFGRFNPPTVGHGKLLSAAKRASAGGDLKIYPSRTQDPKKNPLDPDMKISFMKKMFPDYSENIVNDDEMKSIFNVLTTAGEQGYKNVNIIVGSDRQSEFENLAQKYNGELYDFELIRVISAGVRDADAEGVEGMSASKMRKAVVDGDFDSFRKGTPKDLDDGDTQALFDAVRTGMGVKKMKKESYELWEIAPRYDQRTLRERYLTGDLFKIGDIVENLNTGLIGKIMRRGTNYLICVTEQDNMFKSWIRDVMEAVQNYPGPSGVPSKQREIGTDAHRDYAMRMTGTKSIKNFINKYKVK